MYEALTSKKLDGFTQMEIECSRKVEMIRMYGSAKKSMHHTKRLIPGKQQAAIYSGRLVLMFLPLLGDRLLGITLWHDAWRGGRCAMQISVCGSTDSTS